MASDEQRRSIGRVVSVTADKLVVELRQGTDSFTVVGFDDMHYVARLGSFLLIPAQSEYVIAEIVGLRERERSSYPSSHGTAQELPHSLSAKYLDLVPVGMLPAGHSEAFRFGVSTFPSLYADALYSTDADLDRIFEVAGTSQRVDESTSNTRWTSLPIGASVVFQGYDIKVRIDEFFGGHVAILGNTGSGKSCTVASIFQALFGKPDEYVARGATVVVLDVNGEYRQAFSEIAAPVRRKYLKVRSIHGSGELAPSDAGETVGEFRIPHWHMSSQEWELMLRASEKTQQPVLRTALGLTTLFSGVNDQTLTDLKNHILARAIEHILSGEDSPSANRDRIIAILSRFHTPDLNRDTVRQLVHVHFGSMPNLEQLYALLGGLIQESVSLPSYDNKQFEFGCLEDALDLALLYEEAHGNNQIRDYCAQMVTRLKSIREREEFEFLRTPPAALEPWEKDKKSFVESLLGLRPIQHGLCHESQIIILDMNEAPDEVVEIASAVVSRLLFERLRSAEPRNVLPVTLVLEEAHRYIAQRASDYAIDASRIFERIAKEGRKYGVFIVLASQRPSELSKTVLSQCSNFVVHRIQNPEDLAHIRQMTPYVSDSVMKRLPTLPKQHALIFGNSVNLPTTFRVRDVHPKPKSDDAEISKLWFIAGDQPISWT
jgi:DNA helicase HerA-like ATPase